MMMYTSALDWAWGQSGLKGKEKMVLLFLAYEAGKATFITVGKDRISARCNICKRTVDSCINRLAKLGLISIHAHTVDRKGMPHSYLLHVEDPS